MAVTMDAIQDAANRNATLLGVLSETDYAAPALAQHKRYIADLEKEIQQTSQKIRDLTAAREKEGKDHEKYQRSVMKKLAYRVGGKREKFDEQAAKEEREYFAALEEEHKGNRLKESLEDKLKEAQDAKVNLEPVVQRHDDAQKQLDDLYNRIFAGPTPEFPEEDSAEEATKNALETYRDVQSKLDAEIQVLKILRKALQVMVAIQANLNDAHSASTWDVLGGGLMADMMERSSLGKAETGVTQLKSLINEAARISPFVDEIGEMNIASGHLMSDVFFDNIVTDLRFHERIKDSQRNMQISQNKLKEQEKLAVDRVNTLKSQVSNATSDLEAARKALQRVRTEAISRMASGKSS